MSEIKSQMRPLSQEGALIGKACEHCGKQAIFSLDISGNRGYSCQQEVCIQTIDERLRAQAVEQSISQVSRDYFSGFSF